VTVVPTAGISGTTRVYGLIGSPVEHSLSPAMHNAAFAAMGLDAVYTAFSVEEENLEAAVKGLFAAGIAGLNVTIPHKSAMLSVVDDLTPLAVGVGAINTVYLDRGILKGDNTDVVGLLRAVARDGVRLDGRVVILGAGGAARAALQAVLLEGGEAIILNRTPERAESLAESLNEMWERDAVQGDALEPETAAGAVVFANVLINCTSVGLNDPEATPFPWASLLPPDLYVFDTIYTPSETRLLREARERGCRTRNGLAMLVEQGAESLRIWTRQEPPVGVMEAVVAGATG